MYTGMYINIYVCERAITPIVREEGVIWMSEAAQWPQRHSHERAGHSVEDYSEAPSFILVSSRKNRRKSEMEKINKNPAKAQ